MVGGYGSLLIWAGRKRKVRPRKKIKRANKKQKEVKSKFALDAGEIDSIFDLLEEEHPDLWENVQNDVKN